MSELQELMLEIAAFSEARNWDQFHTPKNLVMALMGEAGELAAEFQWLRPEESLVASHIATVATSAAARRGSSSSSM